MKKNTAQLLALLHEDQKRHKPKIHLEILKIFDGKLSTGPQLG